MLAPWWFPPHIARICVRSSGMDALADVLAATRLGGAVFARAVLGTPWGMAFEAAPMAGFHLVVKGGCFLRVDGGDVELRAGDLALVCHGSAHTIASPRHARATPFAELLARHTDPDADLVVGRGGATTVLVCGGYHFAAGRPHPLLGILPPLIRVRTADAHGASAVAELLTSELAERGIGSGAVTNRLVDALLVYVLRAWLAEQPEGAAGWLGALRDPLIGRALALLHGDSAHPWRVGELGARVGMSRSAFAQRFATLTGEPPHRYLAGLRLDRGAQLLRDTDETILQVALTIGYATEHAFGKAFARRYGTAPGRYRRHARGQTP
jgi:AraC-like DNA-binding protein